MSNAGSAGRAGAIPAEMQKPLQERLLVARENAGIAKSQAKWASPGTVGNWERRDLSTMRLADLFFMAEELKWSLADLLRYLAGDEDISQLEVDRSTRRMMAYLRSLPVELREAACEVVEKFVEFNTHYGGTHLRHIHGSVTKADRNAEARQRLAELQAAEHG